MSKTQPKPILNASLPAQFRQIRIALAREPGHPEGDDEVAYIFVAPLDSEGPHRFKALAGASRGLPGRAAASQRSRTSIGHLVHHPGGGWGFHYDDETNLPDEVGYHFADERFIVGEYVSINEQRQDAHLPRDDGVARLRRQRHAILSRSKRNGNERCEAASDGKGKRASV